MRTTGNGMIVSVDTSVPCIASGVGAPTICLLAKEADWRWGETQTTSVWNPSMQLLRQEKQGDWKPVIEGLLKVVDEKAAKLSHS